MYREAFLASMGIPLGNGSLYRGEKDTHSHKCDLPGAFRRRLAGVRVGDKWQCAECLMWWIWTIHYDVESWYEWEQIEPELDPPEPLPAPSTSASFN